MGFKNFDNIYVINMKKSSNRRDHIKEHFKEVGIDDYEFIHGVPSNSSVVKDAYRNGFVKSYPTCFRCNKSKCRCYNNILIPKLL